MPVGQGPVTLTWKARLADSASGNDLADGAVALLADPFDVDADLLPDGKFVGERLADLGDELHPLGIEERDECLARGDHVADIDLLVDDDSTDRCSRIVPNRAWPSLRDGFLDAADLSLGRFRGRDHPVVLLLAGDAVWPVGRGVFRRRWPSSSRFRGGHRRVGLASLACRSVSSSRMRTSPDSTGSPALMWTSTTRAKSFEPIGFMRRSNGPDGRLDAAAAASGRARLRRDFRGGRGCPLPLSEIFGSDCRPPRASSTTTPSQKIIETAIRPVRPSNASRRRGEISWKIAFVLWADSEAGGVRQVGSRWQGSARQAEPTMLGRCAEEAVQRRLPHKWQVRNRTCNASREVLHRKGWWCKLLLESGLRVWDGTWGDRFFRGLRCVVEAVCGVGCRRTLPWQARLAARSGRHDGGRPSQGRRGRRRGRLRGSSWSWWTGSRVEGTVGLHAPDATRVEVGAEAADADELVGVDHQIDAGAEHVVDDGQSLEIPSGCPHGRP